MRLLHLPVLLLLCSCASNRWDAYDNSSYDVVMEPSDKEYLEHIELLEAWGADERQPMPPGLYMELGFWLAKVGRNEEAELAFAQEVARYPYVQEYLATLTSLVFGDAPPGDAESGAAAPDETVVEPNEAREDEVQP